MNLGIILIAPRVGLREGSIIGCEGLIDAHSNVCSRSKHGQLEAHQTSPGCGNLVLAPSHTTLGETSVYTTWTIVERASSTEICLAKSSMNLCQAHTNQKMVPLLGLRSA